MDMIVWRAQSRVIGALKMRFDPLFVVFLAGSALFLVLDHVYLASPVLVSFAGLYFRFLSARHSTMPSEVLWSWRVLLFGFSAFIVSVISLNILHEDYAARNFERIIPFVLLPAIVWVIRARVWDVRAWLWAVGTGCCLALIVAIRDTHVLMQPRAVGAASNAISFGHISVVMGMICGMAAVTLTSREISIGLRMFLAFGAICGMGASLLSGSKGGWASILLVAIVASAISARHLSKWGRIMVTMASLGFVIVVATLVPEHIVTDRIVSGIQGAIGWWKTGTVLEGSVSARLELWTLGFQLFLEAPVLGLGTGGLSERWAEMTKAGAPFAHLAVYSTTDNELLGALAEGGIVGAVGYYGVYAGIGAAFLPFRKHEDRMVQSLALIGLMLVPIHVLFGLSVSVLGISMFRAELITFSCSLLAFISLRTKQGKV